MQDTNEMQDENAGSIPPNDTMVSGASEEERRAESYKIRLSKARKEHEEEARRADGLAKQLADLKKKFESGKATTNESSMYVNTESAISQAQIQGIHPDDLPYHVEEKMKQLALEQSMSEAVSKDPELRSLMQNPESVRKVPPEALSTFKHLNNAPAVFKHLLTDPADLMVFNAAREVYSQTGSSVDYYQFLSNLSKRLDSTAKYPHPPKFKEIADLSDVGEGDSFDLTSYLTKKYR